MPSPFALKIAAQWRAPSNHPLIEALFLRLLGLIYLIAFASLWPQILGLSGSHGVAPAVQFLSAMQKGLGAKAYFYAPSLFWFNRTDGMLLFCCIAGAAAALLLMANVFARASAAACFVLYLSLVSVGEPFLSFQWDSLLLEAGFLAIFAGTPWLVWAYRLLLFRLLFESGWVKLASHDANWRNLHALRFHFWTQPLPNPIAYYLAQAPDRLLDGLTAVTLFIEFAAPCLLFVPHRRIRCTGVALLIALQISILLTGNYAFFNLLTLALCLWGLDDDLFAPLRRWLEWRLPRSLKATPSARALPWRSIGNAGVTVMLALGLLQFLDALEPAGSELLVPPLAFAQHLQIVSGYGLFAVMTTTRPEIILEGSNDGRTWREFGFPYKPGNTHRGLPWVAPYQPRLDWQMWFAALGDYQSNTWVVGLLYRLITGEPAVYRLMNPSPFPKPPRYMRALLYEYTFTDPGERRRTGAVWNRQLKGVWLGPVSLNGK